MGADFEKTIGGAKMKDMRIVFECRCGKKATLFHSLFQSEDGELKLMWRCSLCKKDCVAIIAGVKPVLPFYTDYDTGFLRSCNVYMKEEE